MRGLNKVRAYSVIGAGLKDQALGGEFAPESVAPIVAARSEGIEPDQDGPS